VAEYLFSLEVLLSVVGEPDLAERWARIAFNALPAASTPDMWAHQYDQQVNQVQCVISDDPMYTTNGPAANIFGLEPNFGCCTVNMGQGWPKFATHLKSRQLEQVLQRTGHSLALRGKAMACQKECLKQQIKGSGWAGTLRCPFPFTDPNNTTRSDHTLIFLQ